MPLKTFEVNQDHTVKAVPFTPEAFAPFGGVMSADHQITNAKKSSANYGTATKIHKVAPIVNDYAKSPSGIKATANWNIFRCTPPKHLIITLSNNRKIYVSKVLERHPFSTQTFVPMGQNAQTLSYLVIVAKNDETTYPFNYPDINSIRAFICKGNQSVTYGKGIWHAPMVVIDELSLHIDFAVLIHENGVDNEDCQECYIEPGVKIEYNNALTCSL